MIILTNKTGSSKPPFMILLLVSISTVFGCGVIPGGQSALSIVASPEMRKREANVSRAT
ncbi:hypothetical protein KIN20_023780 [Parelaphostrongylus tenuis]|uniref:Uncharacterized protein n=1 Tax=Parelaphostrongylus tenuis TaxID=148309 RepID=A0AAD5MW60_PARTN|nr:hypothetical protein KIN20_023776 [Parelaphostrongylus tenuis]KAJ1363833.1 hypothetical protein KIN20_023780 [Parelaphostrongylus tenuis]